MNTDTTFKPGIYRHYKGGLYTAIGLAVHHATRCQVVLYIDLAYGSLYVRPLCGYNGDMAAWNDFVDADGKVVSPEQISPERPAWRRFEYVGDTNSDESLAERFRQPSLTKST